MEILASGLECIDTFQNVEGEFTRMEEWLGVTVVREEVTGIHWESENGGVYVPGDEKDNENMRPGGSIDFQWVPSTLVCIKIIFMQLHGSVSTETLPPRLRVLNLAHNKFQGSFQIEKLPVRINFVNASANMLSGEIDLRRAPAELEYLFLESNMIIGGIEFSSSSILKHVALHDNRLVGPISLSSLPASLERLTLQGNKISQEKLVIAPIRKNIQCIRLGVGQFDAVLDENDNPILDGFLK